MISTRSSARGKISSLGNKSCSRSLLLQKIWRKFPSKYFTMTYPCILGSMLWVEIFWFSQQINPSCWETVWWRYPWTICCCRSNRTASYSRAYDSKVKLETYDNLYSFGGNNLSSPTIIVPFSFPFSFLDSWPHLSCWW